MAVNVVVEIGPARSGKTHRLLERYRATLQRAEQARSFGGTLWIAPTTRSVAAVREQLLAEDVPACLAPGVVTFEELTAAILTEGRSRLRPLAACVERELLRRVVRQANGRDAFDYFVAAARSNGFLELLIEHVRELKRREIEPVTFSQASEPLGHPPGHRELGRLYDEYQRLLAEHALVDSEGRHWVARDLLAADACPSLSRLALVVVDGFTDFTPTQHEVLQLLAARADELRVTLPGDDSHGDRTDLFAKTTATLGELRRRHFELEVDRLPSRPTGWPALDYLSRHLFSDPRRVGLPDEAVRGSLDRLEIVPVAGAHHEFVEIARRIKRMLTVPGSEGIGGVRPEDVVVVFRALRQAAPRLREVFTEFGIPFALESGEPLLSAPVVRTLLALLRLVEEDWPFRRVVGALTNHSLAALDGESRAAADWLVRDLQIAGDWKTLWNRVEHLIETNESVAEMSEHQARRVAMAREARPALRLLGEALEQLPQTATPTQWCDALANLGAQLGLTPFIDEETKTDDASDAGQIGDESRPDAFAEGASEAADLAAWQCIRRHFAALERLDEQLNEPRKKLSRSELLSLLVDVATHERLPRPHDELGRVRILSAATARTVSARHLFLAGMSEQTFPTPEPASRFYFDADYRRIERSAHQQRVGERQAERADVNRSQEEMLLFYEVLTRAEESLTITYPALDDKAQRLPPSPYVTEIERLLESAGLAPRRAVPRLSPIPEDREPLGPAEWRLLGVDRALEGEPDLLAGLMNHATTRSVGNSIAGGLRIVALRGPGTDFGPSDGLITSAAARERLARRFGREHLWSPSQWEQYAACPYKFFLQEVLGLVPLGELTVQTDYRRRGSLLHRVLAKFHRAWNEAEGPMRTLSPDGKEAFLARLSEILAAEVAAAPRTGIEAALFELDRRQVDKWGEGYFEHLLNYRELLEKLGEPLVPTHFELRFGPPRPGDPESDDPASRDEPFELQIGDETILVTGRIDRIDVGRAGDRTLFSVIDYKTGREKPSLKTEQITSGQRLQLPIYVVAAQAVLFGDEAEPVAAGYWSMKRGFDKKGALASLEGAAGEHAGHKPWNELKQSAVDRAADFVSHIRRGDFPVVSQDEDCTTRCEFNTVCRVAQVRAVGKCWPPE